MSYVEPIVHVRDVAASVCRPALVLAMPYERNGPIRARIIRPSVLAVAIDDEEGQFPATDATWREAIVPGTGGNGRRRLDHWHAPVNCPYS